MLAGEDGGGHREDERRESESSLFHGWGISLEVWFAPPLLGAGLSTPSLQS
jgi:hypothetical protein